MVLYRAPKGTNTKVTSAKGHFCAHPRNLGAWRTWPQRIEEAGLHLGRPNTRLDPGARIPGARMRETSPGQIFRLRL